jgi:hypothetical protein
MDQPDYRATQSGFTNNFAKQRRDRIIRQLRDSSTVEEEIKDGSRVSIHDIDSQGTASIEEEKEDMRDDWNDVPANHQQPSVKQIVKSHFATSGQSP